ncbi:glycosyltransferase family 2 protein, partial [Paenibacillus sp. TAF58]
MQVTSIVIPTFNGLTMLKECVASIRSHTSVPFEIIVVDNGSQDGTLEYCYRERLK